VPEDRSDDFKVAWLCRFRHELSKEAGRAHWRGTHGPIGAKVPGLDIYIQSHVVSRLPPADQGPEADDVAYDGYSSGWFADRAAYDAAMASPEWADLVADSPNVFDGQFFTGMCARLVEVVQADGPPAGYKVAWVTKFRDDIDPIDARDHWRQVHGPLALQAPGIQRYVQNHAVESLAGSELGFAGFSECWFADRDACLRALTSPAWDELRTDGYAIFDYSMMWGAALREHPMKGASA
jgi:uncharacterized protein (TIGR02118 family)